MFKKIFRKAALAYVPACFLPGTTLLSRSR